MRRRERELAQEAKAMTREEVLRRASEGRITWEQAASICGITPRHLRRLRERYALLGKEGLRDRRAGRRQPMRVGAETLEELCRLKREVYPDFSMRHFHQFATEKHGLELSYTMTRYTLESRGIVEKAAARGKYRRRRERRPMRGMMVHLDASTHEWIAGLPMRDLVVALDDADGRILHAEFVEQEGTASTLAALQGVLRRYGRFCELYTDRGSHFCRSPKPGMAEENVQVSRALRALGIRQILARSPEARGRGERCFGTLQGRLPQELRVAGIDDYEGAQRYLDEVFVSDFNRRFTVAPLEPELAFVPVARLDLKLVLSIQHERVVQKDNTVVFGKRLLQLSSTRQRLHYVRCPVVVHEFLDGTLGVSHQGQLIARFTSDGTPVRQRRRA
jgi:Helix-turn-helix domain